MSHDHEHWLMELTSLPTATGREQRVAAWVRTWAKARRGLDVVADRFGNLMVQRRGSRGRRPIVFAAHMDHPAFVVTRVLGPRRVAAEFRGGVNDSYFKGTPVRLFHGDDAPQRGVVEDFHSQPDKDNFGANDGGKRLAVRFENDVTAEPGDVLMWDTGPARVEGDRLHAPACDDLAGVAAALGALDLVLDETKHSRVRPDVRVLLTRAEEVGFIGAIAAAKSRTFPIGSRVIAIENSKSFPESPIGGGPIVRVGDFTSTFDPDLTYRAGRIAADLAKTDPAFKYQRKLMPGGTCEASAYQCYGYTATCLCLPLGNYHNMNEPAGRIDAETISLSDYHGLIRLLARIGTGLDNKQTSPPLKARMETLLKERGRLLREK